MVQLLPFEGMTIKTCMHCHHVMVVLLPLFVEDLKLEGAATSISCPTIISNYNSSMGGVDLTDQYTWL